MGNPGFTPDGPRETWPHGDRGPTLVGVSWTLTGFATAFLCLRLYGKYFARQRLWWDDWILIGAWFLIVTDDILTQMIVHEFKLGRHSWDLEIYNPTRFTLMLSSRATVTITAIAWTKTAFAIRLLRITEGYVRYIVWFTIISITITMGFSAAVPWIQCRPLTKAWHASIPGVCWAPGVGTTIWIVTGAYSGAMDFTLAGLPWTFLRKLHITKKEKVGVAVAMGMGCIAGVFAIIKCANLPSLNLADAYDSSKLFMWDKAESTATMMAACIPSLRILLRDVRKTHIQFRPSTLAHISTVSPGVQSKKDSDGSNVAESA